MSYTSARLRAIARKTGNEDHDFLLETAELFDEDNQVEASAHLLRNTEALRLAMARLDNHETGTIVAALLGVLADREVDVVSFLNKLRMEVEMLNRAIDRRGGEGSRE